MRRTCIVLLALAAAGCSQVERAEPDSPQALAELVASGVVPGALPASAKVTAAWEPSGDAAVLISLPDIATAESFSASLPAPGAAPAAPAPVNLMRRLDPDAGELADAIRGGSVRPVRRIGPDGAWVFACDAERVCWAWRE